MKKRMLLLPFLAAMALAGCSNGDDLTSGGPADNENGDLRYLAVNIVAPKESATMPVSRAEGFLPGTADENAVTSALFVLLNRSNTVDQTVTVTDLAPWSDASGNVEKISSAVLVVKDATAEPQITGILAVLNPTADLSTAITAGKTLDEVKALVNNYGTATSGSFVMTNSAYVDAANVGQLAAAVTADNLGRTEDAAKNSPVNIYVERVVAKITTNAVADITTVSEGSFNQGASVTMDGAETATDLKIVIKGVQIANCAQKSYLFKNIAGFETSAPFANWSDATNHRSYWAGVPTLESTDYENKTWEEISAAGNELTAAHTFYAQENVHNGGVGDGPGHTAVIVTAQLQDNTNHPVQLVKLANEYYTADNALVQLAGYLNSRGYRVKTTTTTEGNTTATYTTLTAADLKWLDAAPAGAEEVKGWEGFAALADASMSKTFAKYDTASTETDKFNEVTAEDINTVLQGKDFRAMKWTDGMCYYFVDIEHFGTTTVEEATVNLKGIIRNHIYSLNLQSLKGLGVPVFDPKAEIVPEKPAEQELFYLAARINVLGWKLVSQDVNFE